MIEIIKMGHPLLKEKALAIEKDRIDSEDFKKFVDELTETMRASKGVGIAATQVGVMERVFLLEVKNNKRYPNQENTPLYIIINPKITSFSDEKVEGWEGCLSIPGIRGMVERSKSIIMEYTDMDGKTVEKEFNDFPAVIVQHELDHLDGILFTERMTDMKKLSFLDEYEKYHKDKL